MNLINHVNCSIGTELCKPTLVANKGVWNTIRGTSSIRVNTVAEPPLRVAQVELEGMPAVNAAIVVNQAVSELRQREHILDHV